MGFEEGMIGHMDEVSIMRPKGRRHDRRMRGYIASQRSCGRIVSQDGNTADTRGLDCQPPKEEEITRHRRDYEEVIQRQARFPCTVKEKGADCEGRAIEPI